MPGVPSNDCTREQTGTQHHVGADPDVDGTCAGKVHRVILSLGTKLDPCSGVIVNLRLGHCRAEPDLVGYAV